MAVSLKSPAKVRAESTGHVTLEVIPAAEPGSCNSGAVNISNPPDPHIRGNDINEVGVPSRRVIGAGAAGTCPGFDTLPEREPPVIDRLIAILQVEARH